MITLSFEGKEVAYDLSELDEVLLAYPATVHKSQGSAYAAVVMPGGDAALSWRDESLVYPTALS